jgi:hypothetical protein
MASIALGISGLAGLLGAGVQAGTSVAAANTQASAAQRAAQLQYQLGEQGLQFQQQVYNQNEQNLAPWITAGQGAVGSLAQLLQQGSNGQGPLAPWTQTFTAPTAQQAAATPGYQFTLQQGQQALQNSAAASGGLLSTGTAKNLDAYSQGLASQTYQQTYNNALNSYLTNFNTYNTNASNTFNRYASLAGLGQQATTSAGSLGQQAASTTGNLALGTGGQVGQQYNNIGAAQASGYVGAGNAINGGLGNLSQYLMLQQLLNGGGGGSTATSWFSPYGNSAPGIVNTPLTS